MARIWDWIVGLVMIAISILVGGIMAAIFAFPLAVFSNPYIHLGARSGVIKFSVSAVGIFTLLQLAGFYDFYHRKKVNFATSRAGIFHPAPRAIQRMRTGGELAGFVDPRTGMPVTIHSPINAGKRGIMALLLLIVPLTALYFGATAKGDRALSFAALGLIGAIAGLVLLLQVALAYVRFIRRTTKE